DAGRLLAPWSAAAGSSAAAAGRPGRAAVRPPAAGLRSGRASARLLLLVGDRLDVVETQSLQRPRLAQRLDHRGGVLWRALGYLNGEFRLRRRLAGLLE